MRSRAAHHAVLPVPLVLLVWLGLVLVPGAAAATGSAVLLDRGSVRAFEVVVRDGVPALQVGRGSEVWHPRDVVLAVDADVAATVVQDDPEARVAGLAPGSTVYGLPGVAASGLPALGWAAEAAGASLELGVDGPGRVVALGRDAETEQPVVHLDSAAGDPAEIAVPAGEPTFPTWYVERPGTYLLSARPVLTADGERVLGETTTYRLQVSEPTTGTPAPSDGLPGSSTDLPQAGVPVGSGPDPVLDAPTAQAQATAPPAPARTSLATAPTPTPTPAPRATSARAATCTIDGLAPSAETVAAGHFDYGVQVDGTSLSSQVKDDRTSPPTWRDPSSLLFALGDSATRTVPPGAAYSFLGAEGATVWTIGQTQDPDIPWLGWNTQHASAVTGIDGPTTWRLDDVQGPGELLIYQTGSFGTIERRLGSPAGWPTSLSIPANVHAHADWTFTAPGAYRVTTTHQARLRSGATVSSQATLFFQVGGSCAGAASPSTAVSGGQPGGPSGPGSAGGDADATAGSATRGSRDADADADADAEAGTGTGTGTGADTSGSTAPEDGGVSAVGSATEGATGSSGEVLPQTGVEPGVLAAGLAGVGLSAGGALLLIRPRLRRGRVRPLGCVSR